MKTTIDREGRISLVPEIQSQLGVRPGDDVVLDTRGDELVVKAAKASAGLCYEGNVLVHRGNCSGREMLAANRDERMEQLCEGLPQ